MACRQIRTQGQPASKRRENFLEQSLKNSAKHASQKSVYEEHYQTVPETDTGGLVEQTKANG